MSNNPAITVQDKMRTPHLAWEPIAFRSEADLPPLPVILAMSSAKWNYADLLWTWPWETIFSLPQTPWPDFVDWQILSRRASNNFRIVNLHVR
jgi:hypothetical protein